MQKPFGKLGIICDFIMLESVIEIQSFAPSFDQYTAFIDLALYVKKELNQEAVKIVVNNEMFLIQMFCLAGKPAGYCVCCLFIFMRVRGFNFHNQSVEYSILINIGFIGAFNKSVLDWLGGIGSYIQDSGFILDKDGNKQFLKRFTFYENEHCQDVGLKLLKFREYILKKNPKNTAIILKNESEVLEQGHWEKSTQATKISLATFSM